MSIPKPNKNDALVYDLPTIKCSDCNEEVVTLREWAY